MPDSQTLSAASADTQTLSSASSSVAYSLYPGPTTFPGAITYPGDVGEALNSTNPDSQTLSPA